MDMPLYTNREKPGVMRQPIAPYACLGLVVILALGGCGKGKEKPRTGPPPAAKQAKQAPAPSWTPSPVEQYPVASKTTLLAVMKEKMPDKIELGNGHPARPEVTYLTFNGRGGGVYYMAEKDGYHVVYNGRAGKTYQSVGPHALSPDGKRIAYMAVVNGRQVMVVDGKEGKPFDWVRQPVFSPDSKHLAYDAITGTKRFLVVDGRVVQNLRDGLLYLFFNADGTKLAYTESSNDNPTRLTVLDLASGKKNVRQTRRSCNWMTVNEQRTRIMAIRETGDKKRVFEISFAQPGKVITESPPYDDVDKISFGPDGAAMALIVKKKGKRFAVLDGREEPIPDGDLAEDLVFRPDQKGFGILMVRDGKYFLHEAFYDGGTTKKQYHWASALTYNKDGSAYAYSAAGDKGSFIVVNGKDGPVFDIAVSPLFSPDGKYLVYRARKDGKRFVVVADAGSLKTLRLHRAFNEVFPVTFTLDGKSIAYGVRDGQKLIWEVDKLP